MKRPVSEAIIEAIDLRRELRSRMSTLDAAIDRTDELVSALSGTHSVRIRRKRGASIGPDYGPIPADRYS